jgi:glycosyltransferase involved in cell wall biosynthesis
MSASPLVSLVMPVWKPRRDWLVPAVRAALAQVDVRVELIVIDDGNEAPVEGLLSDIDDERLRVVRIEHGGSSAARNAGLAVAAGSFLRFVDADDVCPPDSTSRLLARAIAHPGSIAYGAVTHCDEHLRPRWTMTCELQGDVLLDCLLGRLTVGIQALLFPHRVVAAAGPWDASFAVSEDWEWVLRTLEHAPVAGGRQRVYLYRRHAGGATTNVEQGAAGGRRIVTAFFHRHPDLRGTRAARQAEALLLARSSRIQLSHGRPGAAIAPAIRSILRDPVPLVEEAARYVPAARAIARRRLAPARKEIHVDHA